VTGGRPHSLETAGLSVLRREATVQHEAAKLQAGGLFNVMKDDGSNLVRLGQMLHYDSTFAVQV
jgi:hypothetical protein